MIAILFENMDESLRVEELIKQTRPYSLHRIQQLLLEECKLSLITHDTKTDDVYLIDDTEEPISLMHDNCLPKTSKLNYRENLLAEATEEDE
jgi:hypothetical protein